MDPTQQQNAMMVQMLANGGAQPSAPPMGQGQDPMAGMPQGMGAAPSDPVQAQAMADMYSQQMAQGQNSSLGNSQGTSLGMNNMYNAIMSPAPY